MDYKIVIDAGHGGDDPGAIGNGIVEKDLNLKIANYMYEQFKEQGISVKIIRSTDETLSPTERVQRVLDAFGNSSNVIVLSNHINAGGGDGAEIIYPLRNTATLPNLILDELKKEGQNIREAYQRRLPSDTSKDYYFMQRNTGNTQALTIEYGFLDSTKGDVEQLKNNYKDYVDAVVRAVLSYIKGNITPLKDYIIYIVQKGDSLYTIANKYKVTIDEIKKSNNLSSDTLQIGQSLQIPTKQPQSSNYITYIVQSGDSLYKIANKYETTVNDIIKLNNLSSTSLTINQSLKIPVQEIEESEEYTLYTVKSGDSLYSIAKNFNIAVDNIKELNNLTNNLLSLGQVLKIPSAEIIKPLPNYTNYTVQKGDSLYSIANKFNTTVNEIKSLNNLSTTSLSLGQILKIPNTSLQTTYTVKSGDSLYSIANKFDTTVDNIKNDNKLSTNALKIGQQLIIK